MEHDRIRRKMKMNRALKKSESGTSKPSGAPPPAPTPTPPQHPSVVKDILSKRPDVLNLTGFKGGNGDRGGNGDGVVNAVGAETVAVGDDRVDTDPNEALLLSPSSDISSAVIIDLPTRADGQPVTTPVNLRQSR